MFLIIRQLSQLLVVQANLQFLHSVKIVLDADNFRSNNVFLEDIISANFVLVEDNSVG